MLPFNLFLPKKENEKNKGSDNIPNIHFSYLFGIYSN
jgi:hypothetical protein